MIGSGAGRRDDAPLALRILKAAAHRIGKSLGLEAASRASLR